VLVAVFAQHARALATTDLAALVAAADRLEQLGLRLVAAETLSSAAAVAAGSGDQRAAAQLRGRVDALAAELEGAATPGLVRSDAVVPLSSREREIADLAASGVPSRDIAARLFISVRTVNNHIQNVYTKLGVRSREKLRAALDSAGSRGGAP
jgi:DNA-binding NarL/FixJ family response regulator